MRYQASVDVEYAPGQPLGDESRRALALGIERELEGSKRITVIDLALTFRHAAVLTVEATLAGVDTDDLTNPLHALTCLDTALDGVLLRAGLFEEFDVARKRLTASAA